MLNKYIDFEKAHTYLDIPYSEYTVPFPNFHTVLNQHIQHDPHKLFLISDNFKLSYSDLKSLTQKLWTFLKEKKVKTSDSVSFNFTGHPVDYIILLGLWDYGCRLILKFTDFSDENFNRLVQDSKPDFQLIFKNEISLNTVEKSIQLGTRDNFLHDLQNLKDYEECIPFTQLSAPALDYYSSEFGSIRFTVYNLFNAAQSLGKHFHLFRPGNTLIPDIPANLTDLMLGFLAPYYYAKTVELFINITTDNIQEKFENQDLHYVYLKKYINFTLKQTHTIRDACILIPFANNIEIDSPIISMIRSFDIFSGMGSVIKMNSEISVPHSLEVEYIENNSKLRLRGHSLFDSSLKEKSKLEIFQDGWYWKNL